VAPEVVRPWLASVQAVAPVAAAVPLSLGPAQAVATEVVRPWLARVPVAAASPQRQASAERQASSASASQARRPGRSTRWLRPPDRAPAPSGIRAAPLPAPTLPPAVAAIQPGIPSVRRQSHTRWHRVSTPSRRPPRQPAQVPASKSRGPSEAKIGLSSTPPILGSRSERASHVNSGGGLIDGGRFPAVLTTTRGPSPPLGFRALGLASSAAEPRLPAS
jgi:hypothetical protein